MSSTRDLIDVVKTELKKAGMTYADLGRALGLAESSVKRMFARADMPLQRLDDICRELSGRAGRAADPKYGAKTREG